MKLIIYINGNYEEENALFDLDAEEVILKGDYYHDKINVKIEGYLQALVDFNIYRNEVDVEEISDEHKYFEMIEFYEGD